MVMLMAMFTREEVEALLQSARQEPEGGSGYHAAVIRQHLEKFDTLKRQSSKDKHWAQVDRQAYLLQKCVANSVSNQTVRTRPASHDMA